MGILDSVLGGGSQQVQTKIPGYIEDPSKFIGYRVNKLTRDVNRRGFNPTQQAGLDAIIANAQAGNPFVASNTDFLNSLYSSGGLNEAQAGLAGALINGEAVNPAFAETQRIAMGGELGQNPFLEATFGRAADAAGQNFRDNVVADLDTEYAASGRSGSLRYAKARGSAEDAYGKQINDLANSIYGGAYQSDLGRRDQALTQLAGLGQQDVSNRLLGAGLYNQGTENLFGALQASGLVDASRYTDGERLFQAGNTIYDQPYQQLERGAGILGQLQFPTSQRTSQNVNPFAQLLGAGIGIAGAAAPYYLNRAQ